MIMRKYLVTIHEDGHVTAQEYEDPEDRELPKKSEWQKTVNRKYSEVLNELNVEPYNSWSKDMKRAYRVGVTLMKNRFINLF